MNRFTVIPNGKEIMSKATTTSESVTLEVRNLGGISETAVEFEPGVNVLRGRNATNRTSLLRAVMAALGSDDVSLKSDSEKGEVELQVEDETYTRAFVRENGSVRTEGDPYLNDSKLADLFAFLLATNEARQAVLTEQNLRELIMRPVNTVAINEEIDSLGDEKKRLTREIEELSELQMELPALEQERSDLSDRIDEKASKLEAKRDELTEADSDVEESREENEKIDELMSEIGDVRSELESVRKEIRAQRDSLESLRERREELNAEDDELPEVDDGRIDEINDQIDQLRERKRVVKSEMNTLQRIIQFNEDTLDGASTDILEALTDGDAGNPTDELLEESQNVVCWTCGHEIDRDDIEETLKRLRELRQQKLDLTHDLDDRIDEHQAERDELKEKRERRRQVREQLERTEERVASREEELEELETRREELVDRIDELETAIDEQQTEQNDEILSLHKEANELEVELNRLEEKREDVTERIENIESELDRREELEDSREELNDRLADLRTQIEQIEVEAVESFNRHMETILEALEYDNIERVWIGRRETKQREGRRKVTRREFTLHIVRESEEGTAYEDTIGHLSESEREVTGLVFALAGYLCHDVHEKVPFMLLDSLEALDSGRIARLVDYFEEYPDYFVAALLPEDAQAVDQPHNVVSEL